MPLLRGLMTGLALLAPTVLAAQQPQTHTVSQGNTLWSLSQQYLGDPLLWPEIYRLNTDVVEDPHWIYPGEVLRLAPGAGISAVPKQDTPGPDAAPPDTTMRSLAELTDVDDRQAGGIFPMMGSQNNSARETIRSYSQDNYRPVRRGEFYGAGFLTEDQKLPFGRVVARTSPMQITAAQNTGPSMLSAELEVSPPKGARYEIGDSLLIVERNGRIGDYGEVITPTGIMVVVRYDDSRPLARAVKFFDATEPGQWVLPLETFPAQNKNRAAPITDGVAARVLGWQGTSDLQQPQRYVFLDKGKADGVGLGDLFEVRGPSGGYYADGTAKVDRELARLQVVHVREHTATAIVIGITYANIARGAAARQVAKLPG
ncbi:MAG TPA: LysM peptidoglycan-binding domain-containing protein [Gemmatimonadales bacterium]|nr:LysM peptidoglycan-binding domain-containing protein [Gemmatimonadales bacterium]